MQNLYPNTKITLLGPPEASATGTVEYPSVDMSGFYGVLFITAVFLADPTNILKVQQSEDDVTFEDLEGTAVAADDDGDAVGVDLVQPCQRYARPVVDRGVATAVGVVYAIQYNAIKMPTEHADNVVVEMHVSPSAGTA